MASERIIPEWTSSTTTGTGRCRTGSTRAGSPTGSRSGSLATRSTDDDRAFIESRDMFFLATADEHGMPQCSYKGGDPGFVRVVDEHTLAFPSYDGNGTYLSLGNLLVNPQVGILFIDFQRRSGCVSTASRHSTRTTRCSRSIPRRSSSSASAPPTSFRTARGTCTGWSSSSARGSSRTPTARRRSPTGSGGSGRTTRWQPEIPPPPSRSCRTDRPREQESHALARSG